MLPPHQALLPPLLPSSCSMQPGFIIFVHGPTTNVQQQHGTSVRRQHVNGVQASVDTDGVVCMALVFADCCRGTQGRLKSANFESGPQTSFQNRFCQLPLSSVLLSAACLCAASMMVCSRIAWCPCFLVDTCMLVVSYLGRYGCSST